MIGYEVYESKTDKLIFAGDLDLKKANYAPVKLIEILSKGDISEGDFISFEDDFLYGSYRNDKIYKVPKSNFAETNISKGDSVGVFLEKGVTASCKILKIDESYVYLDLNHPLVDKNLYIKIVKMKESN